MKLLKIAAILLLTAFLFSCENTTTGVVVTNTSGSDTVTKVFITKSTSTTWGDDLLGNATIPAGESEIFYKRANTYDIRIEDGSFYYQIFQFTVTKDQFVAVTYDGTQMTVFLSPSLNSSSQSFQATAIEKTEASSLKK